DLKRRSDAEGRLRSERVVAVIADTDGVEEAVADTGLQLNHPGVVGDFGNGCGDLVPLMLGAEGQNLAWHELYIGLPIGLLPVTVKKAWQRRGRVRIEIALIKLCVGKPHGLIENPVERH